MELFIRPCAQWTDISEVETWQENFASMDKIWMNCLCDRYSGRQLTDPLSALNKQGRDIASRMAQKLNCKVYYNMYDTSVTIPKSLNGRKVVAQCSEFALPAAS